MKSTLPIIPAEVQRHVREYSFFLKEGDVVERYTMLRIGSGDHRIAMSNDAEKAHYTEVVASAEQVIALLERAGICRPYEYGLMNNAGQHVGSGAFLHADGPHEMAFLAGMFRETRGLRLFYVIPEAARPFIVDEEVYKTEQLL